MTKIKKSLLICLSGLFLLSVSLFIGCNSSVARTINTNGVTDEYTWNYEREFVDEHDADMVIDGKLTEDKWANQHYLQFTENGITMKYTTVFTSYGVYVGAKVENDTLKWNGRFNFAGFWQNTTNNSAFGFKIQGSEVTEEHATTVFNFFVDAKNAASRNQTHFEAKATTNGNIDEGTATEMTAELFVSWKALNIEIPEEQQYPEYVRIYPAYRYVEDIKSANNKWLYPLFSEYGETRLLHRSRFNAEGYMNYDREGAVLGDAANGISKSDGWDLSHISEGVVSTDVYHGQAIFFKGVESDSYAYTTHVKFGYDFPGTGTGHAGVCDMINSELFNAFYIAGYSVTAGTKKLNYHTLNFFRDGESRSNWHDTNEGYYDVPEDKDPYNDGVVITVIKQKEKFFYFIYDDLVLCKGIDRIAGKTCPGFYTLSKNAVFTEYSVTDFDGKEDDINALIKKSAYKIAAPGNISGGTITADKTALKIIDGACAEDLTLNILPNSGYVLTAFNVGGTTYDAESSYQLFLDNCNEGVLTIAKENIVDDIVVTAGFKQLSKFVSQEDIITVSGVIKKSSTEMLSNVSVLIKNANATLCYKTTTTSGGNYRFRLPRKGAEINNFVSDGTYKLYIEGTSLGYRDYEEDFALPADQTENKTIDVTLSRLIVGGSVLLGASDLKSDAMGWDYTAENDDNICVTTSKTPTAKAYFTDTVSTNHYAAVETSFENLTDYDAENYEIEPGIGFFVDTGSRNLSFILTGKRVTILINGDWNNKIQTGPYDLFDTDTAAEHEPYSIKLIHQNSDFTLLFKDGEEWKTIATYQDVTFDRECAYGLTVTSASQKVLLIKFFDYSIRVNTEGSLVTYSDERLTVTANGSEVASESRVAADTLLDVAYENASADKSAIIYVNGKRQGVVAPSSTGHVEFTAKMFFEYNVTVELNDIKVSYGEGIKVYGKNDGKLISSGTVLDFGTKVRVEISDSDKTEVARMYLNGEDTGFYVVNGTSSVDYCIDRQMEFALNTEPLGVLFSAIYPIEQQYVNGREQGYDDDGCLYGPNIDMFSATPELTLNANAVFTTTVKFNANGYATGVRLIIGNTEYRVMGKPWFSVAGNPAGEFRSNYVSFTYGPLLDGTKLSDNLKKYQLSTAVENEQIEIKLIFDDVNDKVYVLINGEDFTDTLKVVYNPSETGEFARVQFFNCCTPDGEPSTFTTWSVLNGDDIIEGIKSTITYTGAGLSVTEKGEAVESGATFIGSKTIDVSYTNASDTKVARVFVNGNVLFTVAPSGSGNATVKTVVSNNYVITVEVTDVFVSYGKGITVYNDETGDVIASGAALTYNQTVKVKIASSDKTQITRLYANGKKTDLFVINGVGYTLYTVDTVTEFSLEKEELDVTFTAVYSGEQKHVDGRAQGYDENGYLYGPNCSYYSTTPELRMDYDSVFTTTVKFNANGYQTGVRFLIGSTEYRIMCRPWCRVNHVSDYRIDYVSITHGTARGKELDDNLMSYNLTNPVVGGQITIKLVFDDLNDKVLVFVNGQEFTEEVGAIYQPTENGNFARVQLFNCCNDDGIPASFKTWSVNNGADAVADYFKSTVMYSDETLSVSADENAINNGDAVAADTQILVEYDNKSLTRFVAVYLNGAEMFVAMPGEKNSDSFTVESMMDYVIEVRITDITVSAGDGITVVRASDDEPVSGLVEYGTKVKVTFANDDDEKIVKLYANGQETGYYVENGELTVEYTVLTATEFKLVDIKFTEYSVDIKGDWFIGYGDGWEN